jgi:hypothetical protein
MRKFISLILGIVMIWAVRNYWPEIRTKLLSATSGPRFRPSKGGRNRRASTRLRPARSQA